MLKTTLTFIASNFWIVNLITLATIAYFLAGGTSLLVAEEAQSSIREKETKLPYSEPSSVYHREFLFKEINGDPILTRNFFDSSVGPINPNPDIDQDNEEFGEDEEDKEKTFIPCDENEFQLLATVASKKNPSWSFASVTVGNETMLHRIGDQLGDRKVRHISWRYLILEGSDDFCYVDLFDKKNRKKKRRKKKRGGIRGGDLKDGIRVAGKNKRIVDRNVVNQIMGNPTKFAKGLRFRPHKKNGRVDGYKVRRLKRSSPLSKLGVKRGDIINEVNGIGLTSMNQVLSAYQKLQSENQLVFSVTRNGQVMDLTIEIQ